MSVAAVLAARCSAQSPDDLPVGKPRPVPAGELTRAAAGKSNKGLPGHGYTDLYERYLVQWRDEPLRILEIGDPGGGSMVMWQEYFPRAKVYGIDINPFFITESARVKTCNANQVKREQLQKCIEKFGTTFDLVIDNGGHTMEAQQVSLGFLFRHVRPGGYYAIEALHSSLPSIYPNFGVEPDESNSTLGMVNHFVHSAPAEFQSKYLTPDDGSYLAAQVESVNLSFVNNQGHSMLCLFKKRTAPGP